MKTELFIVTYSKDFSWLHYCLKSIQKFASGFSAVSILVPKSDGHALLLMTKEFCGGSIPIRCLEGDEWPEKGMLWHMAQITRADEWCPDADYIAHFDPDCIFTAPVTPDTFIKDGKPYLQYERFETIGVRHPGVLQWKLNAERCLPFPIHFEAMRGLPHCYHRELYSEARRLIEVKTFRASDDWIFNGTNAYPQQFCEYVTLGNVALQCFPRKYVPIDNNHKPNPDVSDFPVQQFWSHGSMDSKQNIWVKGVQKDVIPINFIKQVLD
jgi:hypothetical protein